MGSTAVYRRGVIHIREKRKLQHTPIDTFPEDILIQFLGLYRAVVFILTILADRFICILSLIALPISFKLFLSKGQAEYQCYPETGNSIHDNIQGEYILNLNGIVEILSILKTKNSFLYSIYINSTVISLCYSPEVLKIMCDYSFENSSFLCSPK